MLAGCGCNVGCDGEEEIPGAVLYLWWGGP